MRAKEFLNKVKDWADSKKIPPLPPKQNLFHATYAEFLPSILKSGLLPNVENKLYPNSERGVVYLTTSPRTAAEMLEPESDIIDKELVKKLGNTGVLLEINVSDLDPTKFKPDELLPSNVIGVSHSYKYAGIVPPSAIRVRQKISIDNFYYNRKQVQSVRPTKFA